MNHKVVKLVSDAKNKNPNGRQLTICKALSDDDTHECDEFCKRRTNPKKKLDISPFQYAPKSEASFELKGLDKPVVASGSAGDLFLFVDGSDKLDDDPKLKARNIRFLWREEYYFFKSTEGRLNEIAQDVVRDARQDRSEDRFNDFVGASNQRHQRAEVRLDESERRHDQSDQRHDQSDKKHIKSASRHISSEKRLDSAEEKLEILWSARKLP